MLIFIYREKYEDIKVIMIMMMMMKIEIMIKVKIKNKNKKVKKNFKKIHDQLMTDRILTVSITNHLCFSFECIISLVE